LDVGGESLQLPLRGAQRLGTVISGFHERKVTWATAFNFSGKETKWLEANRSHRRRQLMMCKISTVVQMELSLMEDLKQRRIMTTVGKHQWGASQSSSDAFVRGFEESD
jgi:hypothetical protein